MWEVIPKAPEVHVVPTKDLVGHTHTIDCQCRPRRDEVAQHVIIHNARDGREHYEPKWAERHKQ